MGKPPYKNEKFCQNIGRPDILVTVTFIIMENPSRNNLTVNIIRFSLLILQKM